jgi:hypothetical protein
LKPWESQAVNYIVEQSRQMGGTIRIAHTNVGQFWDQIYVLEPFLDGGFKFPFEYGCDTHGLLICSCSFSSDVYPIIAVADKQTVQNRSFNIAQFFRCVDPILFGMYESGEELLHPEEIQRRFKNVFGRDMTRTERDIFFLPLEPLPEQEDND